MKVRILRTAADAARRDGLNRGDPSRAQASLGAGVADRPHVPRRLQGACSAARCRKADFSHAYTFNIDEFVGLRPTDRGSFSAFMQTHLFRHINLPDSHVHFLDGRAPDLKAECSRFEREISRLGGIDLLLLGLGTNGHIGFNEPATSLQGRTHRARLTPETRRANAEGFGGRMAAVPREALTMGMATLPLVLHRGSCCLAYRCDVPGSEELDPGPVERAFRARFGDHPPRYCDTCLFRDAADVDARARWRADPTAAMAVEVR